MAHELTELIGRRGKPDMIVSDQGTEFTSIASLPRSKDGRVEWHYNRARKADAEWRYRILQGPDAR